ncbi:uncharacterized protein YjiS (DUF1127 family) [Plasticicumulans lactativorans]|uniref:Uncharacterized protein YjiS (DUF1127 family) n=1 Tax=Plasticicumulans lactativorans TaxID=1133106 RepID=A0A4R2L7A3_9GAMM|nr:DUF1127 domain-containing protein [Plasticicumulans lactativorans]TCO83369.1 uncharacterized protein YjiS (DUF1127 family) [Plasticicumulans lactativorans]
MTTTNGFAFPHTPVHATTADGPAALLRLWAQRWRLRRALATLDAHMLDDIGWQPYEAAAEARKPFWRA